MAATTTFYVKQKAMWFSWSRRKQMAHMRKHPNSIFSKRYGLKPKTPKGA